VPLLNLNANGFTGVTNQFSLTLPSPTMISVILLELEYHLRICTLAILHVISIYVYRGAIHNNLEIIPF